MGQLANLLGERVRAFRLQRGLSQARLAEAVDVSEEWLRRIERGEGAPSLDLVEALGRALEVQPAALFGRSADRRPGDDALFEAVTSMSSDEQAWVRSAIHLVLLRPGRDASDGGG